MQDFTLTIYKVLLQELLTNGYSFQTVQDFILKPNDRIVILRHDVDRKPENALVIAKIEKNLNIKASYYFRIVEESCDEAVIKQIAKMWHEIGYHYENLSQVSKKYHSVLQIDAYKRKRGIREEEFKDELLELAHEDFKRNLNKFRKLFPIKTICMHGSPLSIYDNTLLWDKFDYREFGIIGEPYFDIDFNEVLYLTDTGRSWNNLNASVRDKVYSKFHLRIKDTYQLIEKVQNNELPDKIMINVHPQRWNDEFIPWASELVRQRVKNVVKKWIIRLREQD